MAGDPPTLPKMQHLYMLGFKASLGKFPLHIGAILSLLKLISVQAGDIPTLNIISCLHCQLSHSTENKHYIHYIHLNNLVERKSDICLTACENLFVASSIIFYGNSYL